MRIGRRAALLAAVAALCPVVPLSGQSVQDGVRRAGDGSLTFHYEVDEDVEICENGIRWGENRRFHGRWDSRGRQYECSYDLAEVRLVVRGGVIRDLDLQPLGSRRADLDLGQVSPMEAVDFLLGLAEGDARDADVAKEAILPAMIADGADVWPRLLELARDRRRPEDVRQSAVFWLGQEAAAAATEGLAEIATDTKEDQDVRESAVFAISQRPDDESVPILMELAGSAEHRKVRESALFWLAQSKDPRVLDFFERILKGGSPR